MITDLDMAFENLKESFCEILKVLIPFPFLKNPKNLHLHIQRVVRIERPERNHTLRMLQ